MSEEPSEACVDDYEMLCVIGKGVFGKVYLVRELKTQQVFAMKVIKKSLIAKQNKMRYIFTERNALIQVRSSSSSASTPSSSASSAPSRTKPSSTSSSSTAQAVSCTTSSPSRRSSPKSSKRYLRQD